MLDRESAWASREIILAEVNCLARDRMEKTEIELNLKDKRA